MSADVSEERTAASSGSKNKLCKQPVRTKQERFIFWDIMQCNLLKVNRRFGGKYLLYLQGRKISQAKTRMKQRTTRRYIPQDRTLRNRRCENPKSYKSTANFLLPTDDILLGFLSEIEDGG
jgi:hypothetical protein